MNLSLEILEEAPPFRQKGTEMIKFRPNELGDATEALFRLTLAPLENDSQEQEERYAELCENAVLKIADYIRSQRND